MMAPPLPVGATRAHSCAPDVSTLTMVPPWTGSTLWRSAGKVRNRTAVPLSPVHVMPTSPGARRLRDGKKRSRSQRTSVTGPASGVPSRPSGSAAIDVPSVATYVASTESGLARTSVTDAPTNAQKPKHGANSVQRLGETGADVSDSTLPSGCEEPGPPGFRFPPRPRLCPPASRSRRRSAGAQRLPSPGRRTTARARRQATTEQQSGDARRPPDGRPQGPTASRTRCSLPNSGWGRALSIPCRRRQPAKAYPPRERTPHRPRCAREDSHMPCGEPSTLRTPARPPMSYRARRTE